jgi:hypothetical protein
LKIVGAFGRDFRVVYVRNHPIASALAVVTAHILAVLRFVGHNPKRVRGVHAIGYGFLLDVGGYGSGARRLCGDRGGVFRLGVANDAISGWQG